MTGLVIVGKSMEEMYANRGKIRGPNHTVQIEEYKIGRRKFHRGRDVEDNWILGVMTTDQEVAGLIPSTSTNFKCGLGLEWGPSSLVRTIGLLLD